MGSDGGGAGATSTTSVRNNSHQQHCLLTGDNKHCWIKMAMGLLTKVVSDKMSGLLKSDEPEKVPPSEKELKEEEKRKVAQKEAEDERKKKHIKEEYQREKVRQNIRDKYGIEKKQPA